ncbi:MAG: DUF3285 domain-containing protein [Prochlorotrichaceae cyanobacterium]
MTLTSSESQKTETTPSTEVAPPVEDTTTPESASYVKLAMRNMVRKRGKSLSHFFLTTITLLGVLIGLSYLTR